MMFRLNCAKLLVLLCVLIGAGVPLVAENIIVQPTMVLLSLDQTIDSENSSVGDPVNLSVVSDVYQKGIIIIKKGAPAKGMVSRADKKSMMGQAGSVGITITTVQAVDGTRLPLTATQYRQGEDKTMKAAVWGYLCLFGFLIKGGDATLQSGYTIEAKLTEGTEINIP